MADSAVLPNGAEELVADQRHRAAPAAAMSARAGYLLHKVEQISAARTYNRSNAELEIGD